MSPGSDAIGTEEERGTSEDETRRQSDLSNGQGPCGVKKDWKGNKVPYTRQKDRNE